MKPQTIWQAILPLVLVVVLTACLHAALLYSEVLSYVKLQDLGLNYALLLLFFTAGQVGVWQAKTPLAKKKEFRRGLLIRLGFGALFLIFSTQNAPEPLNRALHFIVPFLVFTVFVFYQFLKQNPKK